MNGTRITWITRLTLGIFTLVMLLSAQQAQAGDRGDRVEPAARSAFSVEADTATAPFIHPFVLNYALCKAMALDYMYPVPEEDVLACVVTLS